MSSTQPRQAGSGTSTDCAGQAPVSELVQRASKQLTELVRGELHLSREALVDR